MATPLRAAVDINAIEVDVRLNPDSYRQLLQRFLSADTTLTVPELTKIYYGFSCSVDYDPRYSNAEVHRALEQEDFLRAEQLALEALRLNPVSLDLNFALLTAADKLRSEGNRGALLLEYGIKSDQIATAILESGRGTSAHSPFVVIFSSDITPVLRNVIGIEQITDRTTVGDVKAVKITLPGSDRTHILYFDDSREAAFLNSHPALK